MGAESARAPAPQLRNERCLGAAAQLQAVHRTLKRSALPSRASRTMPEATLPSKANGTGLPGPLKAGMEALSGCAMDDVRVHRNSTGPAALGALAYARGSDIHLGPGQERHLPHEAWHVVQQKQGRVRATMTMAKGVAVNADRTLEREADTMGARAANPDSRFEDRRDAPRDARAAPADVLQGYFVFPDSAKEYRSEDDIDTDKFDYGLRQKDFKKIWAKMVEWVISPTRMDDLKNWQEVADEAMKAVPADAVPQVVAPQQVGAPLGGDALTCMRALASKDPTVLAGLITQKLGAKPSQKAIDAFADSVLKRMRDLLTALHKWDWSSESKFGTPFSHVLLNNQIFSGVNAPEGAILDSFQRAIWANYGSYFEEELTDKPRDFSLGSKRKTVKVGGFMTHFTNRATDEDVAVVVDALTRVDNIMSSITETQLAARIWSNLPADMAEALERKDEATGTRQIDPELNRTVAVKASNATTEKEAYAYAAGVINRWKAAANGKINLVFDRAGLKDVYGQSAFNPKATPANMMKGGEGLDQEQRITVNLDAMPAPDPVAVTLIVERDGNVVLKVEERPPSTDLAVTIAHEVAHSIGFNPTECDETGHFKDSEHYLEREGPWGSKILFDAYYFETLIQGLLSGK